MAGRRQHSIPRFLVKGFQSRSDGGEFFVCLYRRAALTISHAGMNTTMQALNFGCPLIAVRSRMTSRRLLRD